jgi:hypothetical protein
MIKILNIINPEILDEKRPGIWDYVDMEVQYENGTKQRVLKSLPEYKLFVYKNELINKGYDEKELEILLDLQRDAVNHEKDQEECS